MARGKFIIVTGLSGAGKSLITRCLEDINFFCVDNLVPALLPKFAQLCASSDVANVALVCDVRGRHFFRELSGALEQLPRTNYDVVVLFLDASDDVLVRRFSETRRRHPLATGGRVLEGIQQERARLQDIKARADIVLDTSHLTARQLRDEILRRFSPSAESRPMDVSIVTFGYKHGIPVDADLVFDVRFLPNPFYVAELRHETGHNGKVREYVLQTPEAQHFLERFYDLMGFLLPQYVKEGKTHLTIGIGCTGGRHRSIAIAGELEKFLKERDYPIAVEHRDVDRE